jgi:ATP-dependent Clp protease ATP-binding subunit ClpA
MGDQGPGGLQLTTSAENIMAQIWPRAADRSMSGEVNGQTVIILVLWSLLRWERKVGLVALEKMGTNLDALATEVDQALVAACNDERQRKPRGLPPGQKVVLVDFQPPKELLHAAECEAIRLGHGYIGSEHLLLATINQAPPRLREVLQSHSVTHERATDAILQLLGHERG